MEYYLKWDTQDCDNRQPYTSFVLAWKYIQSKAQIFTIEVYNSLFSALPSALVEKAKMLQPVQRILELAMRLRMQKLNSMTAAF